MFKEIKFAFLCLSAQSVCLCKFQKLCFSRTASLNNHRKKEKEKENVNTRTALVQTPVGPIEETPGNAWHQASQTQAPAQKPQDSFKDTCRALKKPLVPPSLKPLSLKRRRLAGIFLRRVTISTGTSHRASLPRLVFLRLPFLPGFSAAVRWLMYLTEVLLTGKLFPGFSRLIGKQQYPRVVWWWGC
jgi:hypothetical protein